MTGLASLPPHIQTAIKAIQYAIDHLDPKKKAKAIEDLRASREFLLGSVGLKEKLYDLNQHILDLEQEVAELQKDEDRFLSLWEAERDTKTDEIKAANDGMTMTEAKGLAKRDEDVIAAQEVYLKKREERKRKEAEVKYAIRRWNDLHAQNRRAYEISFRETLST